MAQSLQSVLIPDLGGAKEISVIEVLVEAGQTVTKDQSLITLEGDKASMEIPSPFAGVVESIALKVGDKVNTGDLLLKLQMAAAAQNAQKTTASTTSTAQQLAKESLSVATSAAEKSSASHAVSQKEPPAHDSNANHFIDSSETDAVVDAGLYAGPAARRLARELGVDLSQIAGSGSKGRVQVEDVQAYVKGRLRQGASAGSVGGMGLPNLEMPEIDFAQFGATELKSLSKIQKISGANLHRNSLSIPHVTQFDEADITQMEHFRQQQKNSSEKKGIKLTPLVFVMKAVVHALRAFPTFNASLHKDQLVLKKYFHIGVAVDTPQGLVVPVIRNVDQKSLFELATELATISQKAREKGLSIAEMQGGCFTISSLGGIGGTAFTPIINAPEVAILGVSKAMLKPMYQGDGSLQPRLMLPLSLSYDHRVIDGAMGARFITHLSQCLTDIRLILL